MKTEAKITKYIKTKHDVTNYVPINPYGINDSKEVCTQLLSESMLQKIVYTIQGNY